MKNPNKTAAERRKKELGIDLSKVLVVYNSKYGSTAEYAEWIAEELGADLMAYDKKKLGYMTLYRYVVYIAWIRGTEITHFDLIRRNYENFSLDNREMFYCAVGIADATEEYVNGLLGRNAYMGFDRSRLFVLPGRLDLEKLSAVDKRMLGTMFDLTDSEYAGQEELITERITNGYDGVRKDNIAEVVYAVRTCIEKQS